MEETDVKTAIEALFPKEIERRVFCLNEKAIPEIEPSSKEAAAYILAVARRWGTEEAGEEPPINLGNEKDPDKWCFIYHVIGNYPHYYQDEHLKAILDRVFPDFFDVFPWESTRTGTDQEWGHPMGYITVYMRYVAIYAQEGTQGLSRLLSNEGVCGGIHKKVRY